MSITLLRIVAVLAAIFALPDAARSGGAHWPETLTIGTGSPGGTYYDYGDGLVKLLTRKLDVPVFMRPTEGPTENIKLLEAGEIQLAFVTLGVAQQAWNGSGEWTGGTTGVYMPEFFKVLKVNPISRTGSWSELAAAMEAGALDALAVGAGVPFPEFANLEKRNKVRYLPLAVSQVVALRLALPELGASVVPAGSYPSLTRHYHTVGLYNFVVAHRTLPDDLVYSIAEAVFANHDEMMQVHDTAADTVPTNFTRNTILPFHDGAARWYHNKSTAGVVHGD